MEGMIVGAACGYKLLCQAQPLARTTEPNLQTSATGTAADGCLSALSHLPNKPNKSVPINSIRHSHIIYGSQASHYVTAKHPPSPHRSHRTSYIALISKMEIFSSARKCLYQILE